MIGSSVRSLHLRGVQDPLGPFQTKFALRHCQAVPLLPLSDAASSE
jgi:hypothetical protein